MLWSHCVWQPQSPLRGTPLCKVNSTLMACTCSVRGLMSTDVDVVEVFGQSLSGSVGEGSKGRLGGGAGMWRGGEVHPAGLRALVSAEV